jgi:predicted RNA-binding protein
LFGEKWPCPRGAEGASAVCEATAFLVEDGYERKVMENVVALHFDADEVLLSDLLGEQKVLRAQVKAIDFVRQRVLLERSPRTG